MINVLGNKHCVDLVLLTEINMAWAWSEFVENLLQVNTLKII